MPDEPEPTPDENEEANEAENKPLGLISYPAKPGQTPYGTYQNPNK
jgi:hypothetical protein